MSHLTAGAVSLRRRIVVAAAATAAALAALTSMQAATAHAYEVNLAARAYTFGDCTLTVGMKRWAYGPYAYGYGQASCATRKAATHVTVTLKKDGGTEQTANTTAFTNSFGMGSRWLYTNWSHGCQFQAVMNVNISGYGATYVTTGAPLNICSRSDRRSARKRPPAPTARPRMARLVR
jgi:hypothetical protein